MFSVWTRSLSSRMARWGLVIVGIYLLVALITPLLVSADPSGCQCRPGEPDLLRSQLDPLVRH